MHQLGRIAHIQQTLQRYRRDLGLMTGRLAPGRMNLDDLAILDRFAGSDNPRAMIYDRRLRIKTLEAMLHLLRERNGDE